MSLVIIPTGHPSSAQTASILPEISLITAHASRADDTIHSSTKKPFDRKLITSNNYLKNVVHYIHNNPVHHGFVKQMSLYPWSSYGSILSDKPTKLKRKEIIDLYGNRDEFISYHNSNSNFNEIINFIIE